MLKEISLEDETPQKNLILNAIANDLGAKAFGITPENVTDIIHERWRILKSIYPAFKKLCQSSLQIQEYSAMLPTLWDLWLPLAMLIASRHEKIQRPFVQGILGGQGTGKTTTCKVLKLILSHLEYRTLSLSLDDLYKTYQARLILQQQDPRLIWRGPPGTHDVDLGINLLDNILQRQTIVRVPRFDKSLHSGNGDRAFFETVENIDIVLFEGWFVGVKPINSAAFTNPPSPIITADDKVFARDMNDKLHDYLPLWQRLDSLIVLYPKDYRLSLEWRKQAEHQMKASGKPGMTDLQIEEFVNYFWKALHPELFIKPLINSPSVDLVIEVNPNHSFGKIVSC
ncbi:glycerate kinase [Plectonema cf. radiosum LEGE 06105]|uniref:Glycerate kinase n=1 Tax=Plectonema cf. radiosum LEGE 06105 TaxID=945769 RepID=A0A8J7JVM0_9CYAN|nr:glycerate kinase [Plectonema radiosum]MBE9215969.1 glycerate kinase [Plectonema cf. radiosum LEGE 06105]